MRNSQPMMGNGVTTPDQLARMGGMNMNQMMSQIRQFKNLFHGDPKQRVMQMVQSGMRSNAQLQQAMQMAQQFQGMF